MVAVWILLRLVGWKFDRYELVWRFFKDGRVVRAGDWKYALEKTIWMLHGDQKRIDELDSKEWRFRIERRQGRYVYVARKGFGAIAHDAEIPLCSCNHQKAIGAWFCPKASVQMMKFRELDRDTEAVYPFM